jgi:N-methylhydantoinase A
LTHGEPATSNNDETKVSFTIGVDVGGTFTDVVCSNGSGTWRAKAPTDPDQFARGVIQACEKVAEQLGIPLEGLLSSVQRFGLGTTAVTNVLATGRGLNVGLLTTAGFESHLHMARGYRVEGDGWLEPPWMPLNESCTIGIRERVDREGNVLIPISADDVGSAVEELVERKGVKAIAISFLWSFRNRAHETLAAECVRRLYPDIPLFVGSTLHPVMREYERTTVAVLNAFTADALDGVEALANELEAHGFGVPLFLLHANGGTTTIKEARRQPISLAGSGPAAGAIASAELLRNMGLGNGLCCDMGGTSTDVALIRAGFPERRLRGEVNGIFTAHTSVDVESIGAGGGSIARIDARGLLRVGPVSARARPGPVCYGRGGQQPTVTDAMLVLGYIDASRFLGGAMVLDRDAAVEACARLGKSIEMSAMEIAWGIREIAIAEMTKAVRSRLALAGLDPRSLPIVAYGGSGSLFTTELAKQLDFSSVVTPAMASVLSAYGAAIADVRREAVGTIERLFPVDAGAVAKTRSQLEGLIDEELTRNGIATTDRRVWLEADIHFERQKWELTVPVPPGHFDQERLLADFKHLFETRFGTRGSASEAPVELLALRAIGEAQTRRAVTPVYEPLSGRRAEAYGHRQVWIERREPQDVEVFEMEELRPGDQVQGPALLDAIDTTVWVPEGAKCKMDKYRSLITEFPK